MGNGTIDNPWTLAEALVADAAISAGEHIRLRAGTYVGDFVTQLNGGSHSNPIYVEPYPGERVIICGRLTMSGRYTRVQGIEFVSEFPDPPGRMSYDVTDGSDLALAGGVEISGIGNELVNCVLYDILRGATESYAQGEQSLIYGNVAFGYGWSGYDRGHGHGGYYQNDATKGRKTIKHNIFFDGFDLGFKCYGSAAQIKAFDLIENICFQAESLYINAEPRGFIDDNWPLYCGNYGGYSDDYLIRGNCTYQQDDPNGTMANRIGWHDGISGVRLIDNYWPNGVLKTLAAIDEETGNYYGPDVGDRVFVFPNEYQAGRANIAIYNQAQALSVAVDVSSVLQPGDNYTLRQVQDYFIDVDAGVVAADGMITVPMTGRTVRTPKSWTAPPSTFPIFGAFVLQKV